jgi:hypothetical protein
VQVTERPSTVVAPPVAESTETGRERPPRRPKRAAKPGARKTTGAAAKKKKKTASRGRARTARKKTAKS